MSNNWKLRVIIAEVRQGGGVMLLVWFFEVCG